MIDLITYLETLIVAMIQGTEKPLCYSAHVPGEGYVNDGTDPDTRVDYLRQLERTTRMEIDNLGYAHSYAEPGYTDPERGIVWANWNCFPRGTDTALEAMGYAVEWSDEWTTCSNCGRAIRTEPDSFSYTPSYTVVEGDILCLKCTPYDETDETDDNGDE